VLGVTTIAIIAVAAAVFVIDIIYPLIDPRVKLG
jgi:peptide/nickel transport system permease protein